VRPDDFSPALKQQLAQRVGYRCSMPSCRAATSGPSDSRSSGASNVGVAAHIHAASEGGARYDPGQSPEERRSFENGIWLCQTDGKLIDDDEVRFPDALLRQWKRLAEERAARELGKSSSRVPLAERAIVSLGRGLAADPEKLRFEVDEFLMDIGGRTAWGNQYDLVRMVLYELAINAVEHGGATKLTMASGDGVVSLEADSEAFSHTLLSGVGGGAVAVSHVSGTSNGAFSLRFQETDEGGRWMVVDEVIAGGANTPCSVAPVSPREFPDPETVKQLDRLAGCEHVHVYPGKLWSYSDWFMLLETASEVLPNVPLILHGLERESAIGEHIEDNYENALLAE
jgi:hypothetical protein